MNTADPARRIRVSRRFRLAWWPIPLLLVAILGLWVADLPTSYESRRLLVALTWWFWTLPALAIAILVGRGYLARSTPGLLLFGCGVLIWGAAGPLSSLLLAYGSNAAIGAHNVLACLAALCHLVGVLLALKPRPAPPFPGLVLALGYGGALALTGLTLVLAAEDRMPLFFVHGDGGTPLRAAVLGAAILMFCVTAVVLGYSHRRSASAFVRWYGLAMLLVAVGLLGVLLQPAHGSLLGWTGRGAQLLGGIYMLAAAVAAVRESGVWAVNLATSLREVRQRYADLFDLAGDGILVHELVGPSARGNFLEANPAICRLLGYSPAEMAQLTPLDILVPEDLGVVSQDRTALIEDGVLRHEKRLRAKDGRQIDTEITSRRFEQQGRSLIVSIVRDVTKRKQTEAALHSQTQRYELVLAGAHAAIWDWDVLQHRVVFSPQWQAMRGYGADGISDREEEWSSGIHPDDWPRVRASVQAHFSAATALFMEEYRVRRKDGSWI
jgi:PAS domain S-box-containing protein